MILVRFVLFHWASPSSYRPLPAPTPYSRALDIFSGRFAPPIPFIFHESLLSLYYPSSFIDHRVIGVPTIFFGDVQKRESLNRSRCEALCSLLIELIDNR